MGKREKFSAKKKTAIAQEYLNGEVSLRELAKRYGSRIQNAWFSGIQKKESDF